MGQAYFRDFKVGDACLVLVDDVNTPQGIWDGEVLSVEPREGYFSVRAKITDGRLPENFRYWLGKEPSTNYNVHPADQGTRNLVNLILKQRVNRAADITRFLARESALLDVIVRLARDCRPSMSESEIRKLVQGKTTGAVGERPLLAPLGDGWVATRVRLTSPLGVLFFRKEGQERHARFDIEKVAFLDEVPFPSSPLVFDAFDAIIAEYRTA